MRIILFVCAGEVVKFFYLPDRLQPPSESGYTVYLDQQSLPVHRSMQLRLSEKEGTWYFEEDQDKNYQIYLGNEPFIHQSINSHTIYHVKTIRRDQLWILACTDVSICEAHTQYSIAHQSQITIGKEKNSTIQYDQADFVSSKHAVIQKNGKECMLFDRSSNGTFVNGIRMKESQRLHFADVIWICGLQVIYLEEMLAVKAYAGKPIVSLEPYEAKQAKCAPSMEQSKEQGKRKGALSESQGELHQELYHRAPRVIQYIDCEPIELEAPPNLREYFKQPLLLAIGPSLTMAVPMLLGFAVAAYSANARSGMSSTFMYTGLITAVASGILGTIWATANVRQNKRRYEEDEKRRRSSYEAYIEGCEKKIREKYEHNANAMRSMYPAAGACCRYDEQTYVLWNRNVSHEDFLVHRLGTGSVLFQAKVIVPKDKFMMNADELPERPKQLMEKYRNLYDVPICINLREHRLIGCIGSDEQNGCHAMMRILVAQIATNHPYTEVKTVFLLDKKVSGDGEDRSYVRWFPHVWSEDKKLRYVDYNEGHSEEILYELGRIFRLRLENSGDAGSKTEQPLILPHYVLFIEQYKRFEGELIEKYIFSEAESCGVSVILFAPVYEELPNSCTYIIQNDCYFTGMYDIKGTKELRNTISPDVVSPAELTVFARRLAGIETNETQLGAQMPDTLTLFELLHIKHPEELCLEENWRKSRPDTHLKVAIGRKSGDNVCYLDIHEKAHGPHGLIAGMTGSGKSELLQTYIISMAVQFSPEDVGFFLIDYKGGGMANLFAELPHVVGSISNLSGSTVHRAMVSIKSENRRRQELFNQCGVNNIHEYSLCYRANEVTLPLPHILIMIDEFAELKKEEPEFMRELISVAQVGRSLGVHLILATQKPSGTVDDNIRSNARFRLCLRVQDRQDSSDMLHKADAAYITRTGRAYLQVGNDELYEMFQTAWSGAIYEEASNQSAQVAQLIDLSGKEEHYAKKKSEFAAEEIRGGTTETMSKTTSKAAPKTTQLEAVIEQIRKTVQMQSQLQNGLHKTELWLPALPTCLSLRELEMPVGSNGIVVAIGRYDHPRRQLQDTLFLRLTEGGHHVVCGMVTSGKSTFLQTVIYALIKQYTPEEINIYIVDYSSQALSAFAKAPQVGAFIGENDIGTIKKLFLLLQKQLAERKKLLQGGSFRQYVKTIALLPSIVLVIDQIAMFKEKTDGMFENELLELSRVGEACGIYLLITAGGFGGSELSNRIAENFRTSICLGMSDKYQYAGVLRVMRTEICPEAGIRGRGLAYVDGDILEFQTALALPETDDYTRMDCIAQECVQNAEDWDKKGLCARRIASIPKDLTYQVFIEQEEVKQLLGAGQYLPIGYFSETAHICSLDLSKLYCFLITGSQKTGKSNLMQIMMRIAERMKSEVIVIKKDEDAENLFKVYEQLSDVFASRNKRKVNLEKKGLITGDIYKEMQIEQRYFIFIEDFSGWVTLNYVNQLLQGAEQLVQNLIERGSLHNIYFVAEYDTKNYGEVAGRGIYKAFVDYKTGIHFGGCVGGQRLFDFSYVPYKEQDKGMKAGVGMLPLMETDDESEYGKVIVPWQNERMR